jgi:PilZ domain
MDQYQPMDVPQEAEPEGDRRDAQRLRTVCRIAKILRVDDAGLWMVRNISDGGMMLTTNVPVTVGEDITVMLAEAVSLDGQVVWVGDGKCGVALSEEIDGEVILRRLAEDKEARRYRPLRVELKAQAIASVNHRMRPIEVVNLSQHGAGIVHDGSVEAGMRLNLMLAGGIRREAIVRWSRDGRAGLWLTQPLERQLLESVRHLEPPAPSRTVAGQGKKAATPDKKRVAARR